jgi:hypothetical protein
MKRVISMGIIQPRIEMLIRIASGKRNRWIAVKLTTGVI